MFCKVITAGFFNISTSNKVIMIKIKVFFILFLIALTACNKQVNNKDKSNKNNQQEENKQAQKKPATPKVVLITLDGVRWQELFSGADSLLISNDKYVKDTAVLASHFWAKKPSKRREVLFPFMWSYIAKNGVIYGNRKEGNKVNLTNNRWFSYPGYSEILCGLSDDKRIKSNAKIDNPNKTILELVNNSEAYKNKVAAFASWDVFPSIINRTRSKLLINAGFESADRITGISAVEKQLNIYQKQTPSPWHNVRLDVFTHNYALNYMKEKHPDLVYIAYGETDDFAHDGKYDQYLNAIKRSDTFIKDLWNFVQNDTYYKNNTTFIITTDHGRGTVPLETWKHHGNSLKDHGKTYTIKGSDQVWIAALGNAIKKQGEVKTSSQLYTNQIATTIEKILKVDVLIGKASKEKLPFID